jgi:dTDP-4-amino-4,6-dideoxygalactose transaminase
MTSSNYPAQQTQSQLSVLKPRLPSAEQLLPYLRRIDENRVYANWGPLVGELEQRLAERLSLAPGAVTSAASGTAALIGSILAVAGRATEARPYALLPSFTFVATALAAEQCGYRPHLADVDPDTWLLEPGQIIAHPKLAEVGLVIPVATFGRPVQQSRWQAFRDATGIPVVIDGAASFDRLIETSPTCLGSIPTAMSFHATKCFATGEGGAVAASDLALVEAIQSALNYGFFGTRETQGPSTNGKLSEYHAAVGLAELDAFSEKLRSLIAVAERYRSALHAAGMGDRLLATPEIGAGYIVFCCDDAAQGTAVAAALDHEGVGYRRWYDYGIHRHPYFAQARCDELRVTEELAACALGLPLAPDLRLDAIDRVAGILARAG